MDASSFTAQRGDLNSTLDVAHQLVADILAQELSKNPRIYANQFGAGGSMIPENSTQDNSDLAGWATVNWDGSTTLESLGLASDQAVCLVIFVAEGGNDNFPNVGEIGKVMTNQGWTLKQAVNL